MLQAYRGVISRTFTPSGTLETVSRRVTPSLLVDETVHLQGNRIPSWGHCLRLLDRVAGRLGERINERLVILSSVFARQFGAIAAQRLRRAAQIVVLYNNLGYDRRLIKTVVERLGGGFMKRLRDRPIYLLFGAALFTWEENRISENELSK